MALLIISLILLTILVSMYLLSKNKEKQSDNIVDKPEIKTKTISSSQDKQEWAKRMAEIRKQKKRQREQELIEKEINQQKQYTQLEHSFKELGASIIWQEKLYHKNCYNIYAPEDIDLNKWFLLLEQSIQLSFLLIKDCYFVDNSANNLLKFRFDSIIRPTFDHTYVSFEDNGNEKYFSGKKVITKNTYSIHHFCASWTSAKSKRTTLIKRIIGVKLYSKLYGKFLHRFNWLEW